MPALENGFSLVTKGYGWLPDLRRAAGRPTVPLRLLGLRATALEGPDAARFFYDEDSVRRSRAIPEPVRATLFGEGAVHTLDGEAHRVRKAMFVALLMQEDGVRALVDRATTAWDDAAAVWAQQGRIVLFEESADVLAGAVCRWAGLPVDDDEVPAIARDLQALVDGFATAGPRHWRARRARSRREAWLGHMVEEVRSGVRSAPEGSALAVVAGHRDADGHPLSSRLAAVELLNVIRPTVAISWFLAFSAHALVRAPSLRDRLAGGDAAYAQAFAHEVRRFYPFAPFIGGRAPRDVEWDGQRIPRNSMVLLDLYGQNHDAGLWGDPYVFRPERFLGRDIGAFGLVPQGGGDTGSGHRCPGEQVTVALLAALAVRLARLPYVVPEQDLTIPLHRIPTRPRSGMVLLVRG